MAVRICTGAGDCIECGFVDIGNIGSILERMEKEGKKYVCCGKRCVRIDQISIIEEIEMELPDDDDDDGRPIFGDPEVVIITGGRKVLRQRRAPQPDAEPVTREDEWEPPPGPWDSGSKGV